MLNVMEYSGGKLAVLISGSEAQRHVGFFLKDGQEPELIHLAWHMRLSNNSTSEYVDRFGKFVAYECQNFLDEQAEDIVSFVKTIWRKNRFNVPYGIGSDSFSTFFDGEGSVSNRSPGSGLTCATFLMSVFASQLYPVICESTWQKRPEDEEWQEMVLAELSKKPELADHVAELRKIASSAFRYRPEEVAACSALYDSTPIVYSDAVIFGEQLLDRVRDKGVLS
ncbi:hypothetical protein [Pseudomonas sp. ICMP 460]|uniref:hypothetical protein n=1 Tax=Pseudomonas sp. ICMP 460 TaxID=1718917 RepID=UPI000C077095|nr:hypothetical protein [Pseudomonas sp. ICMP 460]PHN30112.1 hypothetical protein AO240_09540 [Pseudomonas sp. ICMP 460]